MMRTIQDILKIDDHYQLDINRQLLLKNGFSISLSRIECRILYYLALHLGRPVPSEQIIAYVWGDESYISKQSLYVYINRVRKHLEDDPKHPKHLLTIHGFGYILALHGTAEGS